jgi:hypothetical protein
MKVNPLGIQAYQQMNRSDRTSSEASASRASLPTEQNVVIEPQSGVSKSAVAVKAPAGSYAKFLSAEERQALDLLFTKFSDTSRFGSAYAAETSEAATEQLGRLVDVKV